LSAVDLGPHADRILSILQSDVEIDDAYPIYGYALLDPDTGGLANRCVFTPTRTRTEGQWNYEVALLGCAWKIFVSSSAPPLPSSCMLKRNGTIVMPVMSYTDFPAIRRMFEV
jgi:hypothetical protein